MSVWKGSIASLTTLVDLPRHKVGFQAINEKEALIRAFASEKLAKSAVESGKWVNTRVREILQDLLKSARPICWQML